MLHLPVARETSQEPRYKPPLKTTLLGESKRLLASQKWGQDNGSIQGKMVIRGRNSISSEMQDAAKARPWFGVLR